MGHILMENRNGLIVDVEVTHASGTAEREADRMGIELAAKAGYDPRAAVTLWEKMAEAGGKTPVEFLSTHPAPENRSQTLSRLAPAMMKHYRDKRPRYVYRFKS